MQWESTGQAYKYRSQHRLTKLFFLLPPPVFTASDHSVFISRSCTSQAASPVRASTSCPRIRGDFLFSIARPQHSAACTAACCLLFQTPQYKGLRGSTKRILWKKPKLQASCEMYFVVDVVPVFSQRKDTMCLP